MLKQFKASRSLSTWGITGLLALVLLLVLTACGGSSTPSSNTPSAQQLIKNAQAAI